MKIILSIFFMIQFLHAQPRPTGNVLTENERILVFQDLEEKEKKLITLLNKHIKKCLPSFQSQTSILAIMANYQVIRNGKSNGTICSSEQILCLDKFSIETGTAGLIVIKNPSYNEYLINKHKLTPKEANVLILDLKKWFIGTSKKNDFEDPIINKS